MGDRQTVTLAWEVIDQKLNGEPRAERTKIPGGWLVVCRGDSVPTGLAFVPDPKHEWDGKSVK